jgi:uncharacterized membrane protein HdeD (DUF308 family)
MTVNEQAAYSDDITQKYWWVFLAWAVFAIIAGILLITRPGVTAFVWVQILAVYLIATGVFEVIGAVANRQGAWVFRLLAGVVSILAGGFVVAQPLLGMLVAVQIMFAVLVVSASVNAVINLVQGVQQPRSVIQIVLGVFQAILALWLLGHPLIGLAAMIPIMGGFLIAYGVIAIILTVIITRA